VVTNSRVIPLQTIVNVVGEERAALIKRIQFGGDEVVKAKDGAGSATLSMAWAAAKFTDALLRAMSGEKGIIIPTFVQSDLYAHKVPTFKILSLILGM
jgi:malate dehydrogenase